MNIEKIKPFLNKMTKEEIISLFLDFYDDYMKLLHEADSLATSVLFVAGQESGYKK